MPGLLILILSIMIFSASAQTPQPASDKVKGRPAIKVSTKVLETKAIKKVKPVAPAGAPASGVVRVRVWIDIAEGKVVDAEVVSGDPLLRESALKAARQWEWEGACIGGVMPPAVGVLNFDFSQK